MTREKKKKIKIIKFDSKQCIKTKRIVELKDAIPNPISLFSYINIHSGLFYAIFIKAREMMFLEVSREKILVPLVFLNVKCSNHFEVLLIMTKKKKLDFSLRAADQIH